MANAVIVDASVLIALVLRRDHDHRWAFAQSQRWPPPWLTCEAALSETFFTTDAAATKAVFELLRRRLVEIRFDLGTEIEPVLALMEKYRDVPMSLADACLVRMTEIVAEPVVLTKDSDFRIYRRHSRLVIPTVMP